MDSSGRSSTGCDVCRKRKIKCDEGKPGCKRCAHSRIPCPGYPLQVQFKVRTQPQTLLRSLVPFLGGRLSGVNSLPPRVATDQEPSSLHLNPERSDLETENVATNVALEKLGPASGSISPPPRHDVQHQAICFFLNLFCFQAGRLYSFPVLDFLPGMIRNTDPHSCIHHAALAVSRMTLADRYSGKDVRLQTGTEYGHALSLANKTIRDTQASVQDETVVAVWLLGLYEMMSLTLTHGRTAAESMTLEEEWQSHLCHVRGAMNLLRLRGMSQFTTTRGEKVFRIFKAAIQMRLFLLNSVISKDFDGLEIDVYQDEHEFLPSQTANRATAYFHKVARLLEKIKYFLAGIPKERAGSKVTAEDFLGYGETLDNDMNGWSKDEPGWDMMEVQGSKAETMWAHCPSHAKYYFHSFWVFLYWLRFLAARFRLYEGLIELVKLQTRDSAIDNRNGSPSRDQRISQYQNIIRVTSSEIIGLTAYALGDVTPIGAFNRCMSAGKPSGVYQEINVVAAMQLVIPLKMMQRSEHPTAAQKRAVDLAISHIGDGFRRQPVILI